MKFVKRVIFMLCIAVSLSYSIDNILDVFNYFNVHAYATNTLEINKALSTAEENGAINVKQIKLANMTVKGDGKNDDTVAIQNIINSCEWGDTLYFPKGEYKVSGLVIKKAINIIGYSKTATFIINTSKVNPCIKITMASERIRICNIGIWGNGTKKYGSDATSSYGIELDECAAINIDNIWMRGHGNHAIYASSANVNNINISNSEIEWCKQDGINITARNTAEQKNAINITNCNIAVMGKNGISVWGNSMSISNNTIQDIKEVGINVSSNNSNGSNNVSAISIQNNYFELCKNGFILVKAGTNKKIPEYIDGIRLIGNFGHMYRSQINQDNIALVTISSNSNYIRDSFVRDLEFNNDFASDTLKVLNANNCLSTDSYIKIPYNSITAFVNLGAAKINYIKSKVINGYFYCKGVQYDLATGKSSNLISNSVAYYPIDIDSYSIINNISICCETDATNYTVQFDLMSRDKNTVNAYAIENIGKQTLNGTKVIKIIPEDLISTNDTNIDMYLRIVITISKGGKYLYIGNPVLEISN